MIESNLKKYSELETLNVSRETFPALEEFRSLLLSENKKINLISKSTEKDSIKRHIIDSAQIIDIIDKNTRTCLDIGSGSGLPGVVLAIILKKKGSKIKFKLYEKSMKKSNFLFIFRSFFDVFPYIWPLAGPNIAEKGWPLLGKASFRVVNFQNDQHLGA